MFILLCQLQIYNFHLMSFFQAKGIGMKGVFSPKFTSHPPPFLCQIASRFSISTLLVIGMIATHFAPCLCHIARRFDICLLA